MARRGAPEATASGEAEAQVQTFIAKFSAEHQALIRAVRRAVHRRLPTAFELAYDNYNFFVLGYGPTERPSDSIISIAAGANGVGLCFIHGASMPDPSGILLGGGKQTRFIRLESAEDLERAEVEALLRAALTHSSKAMRDNGGVDLVVRSVSTKQRPRRKPPKPK